MLNQVVLVGRLTRDLEVRETENGTKVSNITLAVPRSYKNKEGVYDTDFIDVTLWNADGEKVAKYCKKGDMVGVKARLQADTYEKDGKKKYALNVVADKIAFLSSKNKSEPEL